MPARVIRLLSPFTVTFAPHDTVHRHPRLGLAALGPAPDFDGQHGLWELDGLRVSLVGCSMSTEMAAGPGG